MFGYLSLCIAALFTVGISQMLGPADVRIKSVEPCPEREPYQSWIDMTYRRINRTTEVFDINATFAMSLDDQVGIYMSIAKMGDGGYKKAYEMKDDNICEFLMKYVRHQFTAILRLAGIEEKCPIPPGSHLVRNYTFDFEQMPPLAYGEFILQPEAMKDGKPILCFRMLLDSTPKDHTRYTG